MSEHLIQVPVLTVIIAMVLFSICLMLVSLVDNLRGEDEPAE